MLGLVNIFLIAEWVIGSQDNLNAFEQKLLAIFRAVEDLRLALGEKVTSVDLEVNVVGPDFLFDHRWMEDGYGDARQGNMKKSAEVIAGTTGIGLKKVVQSPSGDLRFENVLAPKVVLKSTLEEALAPPPKTRSNKKGGDRGQEVWRRSFSSKAPPLVKEVIQRCLIAVGLTKNHQTTAVDNEHISSSSIARRGDGRDL